MCGFIPFSIQPGDDDLIGRVQAFLTSAEDAGDASSLLAEDDAYQLARLAQRWVDESLLVGLGASLPPGLVRVDVRWEPAIGDEGEPYRDFQSIDLTFRIDGVERILALSECNEFAPGMDEDAPFWMAQLSHRPEVAEWPQDDERLDALYDDLFAGRLPYPIDEDAVRSVAWHLLNHHGGEYEVTEALRGKIEQVRAAQPKAEVQP